MSKKYSPKQVNCEQSLFSLDIPGEECKTSKQCIQACYHPHHCSLLLYSLHSFPQIFEEKRASCILQKSQKSTIMCMKNAFYTVCTFYINLIVQEILIGDPFRKLEDLVFIQETFLSMLTLCK